MRKIKPLCNKRDIFKYSMLISLNYYEINCHPERITKLKPFENKYNFTNKTFETFEKNNPFISLTVYDENGKLLHEKTFILPHSTFYNFYDFFCFVFNK